MIYAYIIIIVLFIILFYLNANFAKIKGNVGERRVNNLLKQLGGAIYKIHHDVYVPTEDNKTTQVDHIVVSPYGIFVIETKHYNGWIFGDERNRYWTQVIYKRKEKFFNPIWQNAGHIKALEDYLGIDRRLFISVIAFSNQSTFKFKKGFTRANVIHFTELQKTIHEHRWQIIDHVQLDKIHNMLDKLAMKDKKEKGAIKQNHERIVRLKVEKGRISYFDKTKCPRCHSDLVKRKGKYGAFMGCDNYPKCSYTANLK